VRTSRPRRSEPGIEGALRDKLLAAIAEQPGRRTEELNAALGTSTKQIAQLLRRLVTDNLVRTEGARRDTRYFAIAGDAQNGRRPAPPVTAPPAATATAAATPTAASVAAVVAESAAAAEAAAVAGDQPPSLA
jgi:predicted ArsR family transcriptional regulator